MELKGAITALVTPMKDGAVDDVALRDLVEWQIGEGIDGLAPAGTTGESATLRDEEHARVIRIVVEQSKGRVPVIAGAGTVSTHHSIALGNAAKEAGADALLLVTPYYNRPSPKGLVAHFSAILSELRMPVVLYNVPKRTGCDLGIDVLEKLVRNDLVIAVKEASGQVSRAQDIAAYFSDYVSVLSGEDALNMALLSVGASGVISVTSNVLPRTTSMMVEAYASGNSAKALALHRQMLPLHRALFLESNPGPVKFALAEMQRIQPEIRLPLVMPECKIADELKKTLKECGVN